VRGEVTDVWGHFLDLVVFDKKHKPLCVIEAKKRINPEMVLLNELRAIRRQVDAYQQTGIPVCLVMRWVRAKQLLAEIKASGLPKKDWHCDEFDMYL
jgi:hypothetical protein